MPGVRVPLQRGFQQSASNSDDVEDTSFVELDENEVAKAVGEDAEDALFARIEGDRDLADGAEDGDANDEELEEVQENLDEINGEEEEETENDNEEPIEGQELQAEFTQELEDDDDMSSNAGFLPNEIDDNAEGDNEGDAAAEEEEEEDEEDASGW